MNKLIAPNREWFEELFTTIDAMDAQSFANYFTDDGDFLFGSFPPARGRSEVKEFVAHFFSSLKALRHRLGAVNEVNGIFYIHFDVTYELDDGREVAIPGLETIEMQGEQISRYVIYMDPSPLQALQSSRAR